MYELKTISKTTLLWYLKKIFLYYLDFQKQNFFLPCRHWCFPFTMRSWAQVQYTSNLLIFLPKIVPYSLYLPSNYALPVTVVHLSISYVFSLFTVKLQELAGLFWSHWSQWETYLCIHELLNCRWKTVSWITITLQHYFQILTENIPLCTQTSTNAMMQRDFPLCSSFSDTFLFWSILISQNSSTRWTQILRRK